MLSSAVALGVSVLAVVSGNVGATHIPASNSPTTPYAEQEMRELLLPSLGENPEPESIAPSASSPESGNWKSVTVKAGDTLGGIFKRLGLGAATVHAVVSSSEEGASLARITPGQVLSLRLDDNGGLLEIDHQVNEISGLRLLRVATGVFAPESYQKPVEMRIAYAHGTIDDSLFVAGKQAGLSNALIMEMADLFGWDIDFALDIRRGDRFTVVYEEAYLGGDKIGHGAIVAAEFINQGRKVQAVRHLDEEGSASYYTPDGLSMRKAFLRTPVKFARISSHFNLRRKHPVLHKIRAHKGVDYAASSGTPVLASGDGKVIHAGKKGGYGNAVILQHGQSYTTLYAHLLRLAKGVGRGARVKQGQVVGYVGKSGLATGPHLHYEFRVNGVHKNPVTVELPQARPIAAEYRDAFEALAAARVRELGNYGRLVAALDR